MVEGRSCLVARRFSRSCHQEINWACMSCKQEIDNGSSKRQLNINSEENVRPMKLYKLSVSDMQEQLMLPEISQDSNEESIIKGLKINFCVDGPLHEDESDNRRHAGDSSDADAIIHSIVSGR